MREKLRELRKRLAGRWWDSWAAEPEQLDHIDNLTPMGHAVQEVWRADHNTPEGRMARQVERYEPRHRKS